MKKFMKLIALGLIAVTVSTNVTTAYASEQINQVETLNTVDQFERAIEEGRLKLTDDIVITDSEGVNHPVYEIVDPALKMAPQYEDEVSERKATNIQDYYEHMNWRIKRDQVVKGEPVVIGLGQALYINDVRWDKGEQILLGMTNGENEYVSPYSNGSFSGHITARSTDTYQFMVKYTGFDRSIDFMGFLTGYPWRMGDPIREKEEDNYEGLTDEVIIETSDGVRLPVYKFKVNAEDYKSEQ